MYTTNPKVQEAAVTVQIRPSGEYNHRRKVIITLPATFNLDDRDSTKVYYHAWSAGKSLPKSNPYFEAIEAVQSSPNNIRLHELMLTSCKEKTFVSVIGETSDDINHIIHNLNQIFGDGIAFDTL